MNHGLVDSAYTIQISNFVVITKTKKPLWYSMAVNEKDEVAIHYLDAKLVPVLLS